MRLKKEKEIMVTTRFTSTKMNIKKKNFQTATNVVFKEKKITLIFQETEFDFPVIEFLVNRIVTLLT